MMNDNKLRYLLENGQPSVATRILSTWPNIAETAAVSGNFDYLEFSAEYAPFSQYDLENIPRALEIHNVGSMIKVDFQNRGYVAQKAVASGFQAVLFTDLRTADEVRESICMLRPETPKDGGRFGYPNRRWIGCRPYRSQMDYAAMLRKIVIAVMIEKAEAMENIEEICSIPGVDMVQFGPSDYSMSKGWNFKDHEEEVRQVELEMIKVALKHNVQPRCEINHPDEAQKYIEHGVKHFSIGDEMRNNIVFWDKTGGAMRKIADSLK